MSKQAVKNTGASAHKPKRRFTRRGFLIGLGVTGVGLAVGIPLGLPELRLRIANQMDGGPPGGVSSEPFAWFEVVPEDRVRLFVPKVEMGQGVHTALAQIAADELEVSWEKLEVVQGTSHRGPDEGMGTVGSFSVASLYTPLREGAALLREMLKAQAAVHLNHDVEALVARDGGFEVKDQPEQRVTYGALVAEDVNWQEPEGEVPLKATSGFRYIGQPTPRVDVPAKVMGTAIYGYDMRVEGMCYGAVVRPPTIEARMISARPGGAEAMPGVVKVVIEDGFAGVVARSRAEAAAARDALEVEWEEGRRWQQEEIEALVTVGTVDGNTIQREGDAADVLKRQTSHTAEYRTPFAVQTPLEPQAALADVRGENVKIWVSTQGINWVRDAVSEALGIGTEHIEVIPTYLGGGFGRKGGMDCGVEAARLSRAAGVPVHVGWSRTEELRYGHFRPPTHHRLEAALDEAGQVAAIDHHQASGDVLFILMPKIAALVLGADLGAWRGARITYAIPHRRAVAYRTRTPVSTGPWRGLGLFANTFAVESFVDELAFKAGVDPLQFRLNHLPDDADGQRMRKVLEAAAEKAGWGTALPEGHAHGIACCIDVGTVVAQVADVSVERETGQVRVHRIVAAMDCGRVINPDGARAQVEGNIIWGVGSTLMEQASIKDGRVALTNFNGYPLLTMRQAPDIETLLLEAPDGVPRGVGEPPIGPTGAAIANALFTLTGVRMRTLPLTPDRVKEALG